MLRKIFIPLIALFLTQTIYSQEDTKWEVGAFFMPSMVSNYKITREFSFSPVFGIVSSRKISNQIKLSFGLNYYTTDIYNGSWHGAPCVSPIEGCYLYSKRTYCEIPINGIIYYSKNRSKVNPYFSIGLLTSFSIKSKNTRINESGSVYPSDINEYNGIEYQHNYFSLAMGTEFIISDNYNLYVEPFFKQSINTILRDSDYNHTIMIGLKIGMNIKI